MTNFKIFFNCPQKVGKNRDYDFEIIDEIDKTLFLQKHSALKNCCNLPDFSHPLKVIEEKNNVIEF
jgi:hypothetical protein